MTIIRCVLLLVVLVTWNASLASAQNTRCDASQFDALTNMWKLEPDQNTRQVPAGELAAERKVMQRVVEMFKSAFVPTGAAGLLRRELRHPAAGRDEQEPLRQHLHLLR